MHIGRIRQVLELDRNPSAPSTRLPYGPHGYVLRVEPDELDAERFERLVLLAREAVVGGDPALCGSAAHPGARPVAAGRRSPTSGTSPRPAAEIARLDDLRAIAIEELADARLALGEHTLAVDLATAALDEFPLRERLTASLMLGLYRGGRQAERFGRTPCSRAGSTKSSDSRRRPRSVASRKTSCSNGRTST